MMRLRSASIEGFRAFASRVEVDLNAEVIILQGPNGVGKTSLLDAMLWALTGQIERFEGGSPVSLYAREGIARVELTVGTDAGEVFIARIADRERQSLRINHAGQEFAGPAAESMLAESLLPHLRGRNDASATLSSILTRGVYLQQDLVRQFIEEDTAGDRFHLIGEIIGAGAVLELQSALERSRLQWSRNTTSIRKEKLDQLVEQLSRLDDQLSRLDIETANVSSAAQTDLTKFYSDTVALIGSARVSSKEAPTNSAGLDRLLKEIAVERMTLERELAVLRALASEAASLRDQLPDHELLQATTEEERAAAIALAESDAAVDAALIQVSQVRDRLLAEHERAARLSTMAQLALDELGDKCPVCRQVYDREATEDHLRALMAAEPSTALADSELPLREIQVRRTEARARLEAAQRKLRDITLAHQEYDARQSVFRTRLADLGKEGDDGVEDWLTARAKITEERSGAVTRLIRGGDNLSLSIVRVSEQRRKSTLQTERATLLPKIEAARQEVARLDETHAMASKIIELITPSVAGGYAAPN